LCDRSGNQGTFIVRIINAPFDGIDKQTRTNAKSITIFEVIARMINTNIFGPFSSSPCKFDPF
jgi:hypothetical protein